MVISAKYINNQFNMSLFDKIKYIGYFITKSILYAALVLFIILALFITVYFGDLLYNVNHGNNKMPLFNAYVIVSGSMIPTIKIVQEMLIIILVV